MSWGHHLTRGAEALSTGWECTNGLRCPGVRRWQETIGGREVRRYEGGKATHTAGYRYVTGRGGRVGHRRLRLCDSCAEKFAKRNGLPWPATEETKADPDPRDVAVAQLLRSFGEAP